MTHRKTLLFIRLVYWAGILVDLLVAVQETLRFYEGLLIRHTAMGGSGTFGLVAAWTVLLIWADRKPVERRVILLFTTLIIAAKALDGWLLVISGLASFRDQLTYVIGSPVLGALFATAYWAATRLAKAERSAS